MGLASVDELITLKVFLQLLDNFDSHLQVMSTVSEDQLTDLLTLVGTLLDQRAIVPEEMLGEKFVEVVLRGVLVFIDLDSELLEMDWLPCARPVGFMIHNPCKFHPKT